MFANVDIVGVYEIVAVVLCSIKVVNELFHARSGACRRGLRIQICQIVQDIYNYYVTFLGDVGLYIFPTLSHVVCKLFMTFQCCDRMLTY